MSAPSKPWQRATPHQDNTIDSELHTKLNSLPIAQNQSNSTNSPLEPLPAASNSLNPNNPNILLSSGFNSNFPPTNFRSNPLYSRPYSPYMNSNYGYGGYRLSNLNYSGYSDLYSDFPYGPNWIDSTADMLGRFTYIMEMNSYFVDQLIDLTLSLSNRISIIHANASRFQLPKLRMFHWFYNAFRGGFLSSQRTGVPQELNPDMHTRHTGEHVSGNMDKIQSRFLIGLNPYILIRLIKYLSKMLFKVRSLILAEQNTKSNQKIRFRVLLFLAIFYLIYAIFLIKHSLKLL